MYFVIDYPQISFVLHFAHTFSFQILHAVKINWITSSMMIFPCLSKRATQYVGTNTIGSTSDWMPTMHFLSISHAYVDVLDVLDVESSCAQNLSMIQWLMNMKWFLGVFFHVNLKHLNINVRLVRFRPFNYLALLAAKIHKLKRQLNATQMELMNQMKINHDSSVILILFHSSVAVWPRQISCVSLTVYTSFPWTS